MNDIITSPIVLQRNFLIQLDGIIDKEKLITVKEGDNLVPAFLLLMALPDDFFSEGRDDAFPQERKFL